LCIKNDNKYILFPKILKPFTYVLKASSKGIRAKLVQALNYWLNVPAEKLAVLQEAFQVIHDGVFL
jgi:geranylgeranyl diphosphate synthase type 3